MTEQERALLMAIGAYMCVSSSDWTGRRDALEAAYERAAQPPAEPKPSGVVNKEAHKAACKAAYGGTWTGTNAGEIWRALHAAAPYITAAKDDELSGVIRDNDAKTAEIERLKAEVKFLKDDAGGYLKVLLDTQRLAIERGRELEAIRNPDIDAAADAGLAAFHRTYADSRMQWRAVARAILKR